VTATITTEFAQKMQAATSEQLRALIKHNHDYLGTDMGRYHSPEALAIASQSHAVMRAAIDILDRRDTTPTVVRPCTIHDHDCHGRCYSCGHYSSSADVGTYL